MAEQDITQVSITEEVKEITVSNDGAVSVNVVGDETDLVVNNFALPISASASNVSFTPYGQITATTIDAAVRQLADLASYSQDNTPAAVGGSSVSEGNIWYDTDDDQLKVYRETSTGTFEWVPIIVGAAGDDSDTLDAGAF